MCKKYPKFRILLTANSLLNLWMIALVYFFKIRAQWVTFYFFVFSIFPSCVPKIAQRPHKPEDWVPTSYSSNQFRQTNFPSYKSQTQISVFNFNRNVHWIIVRWLLFFFPLQPCQLWRENVIHLKRGVHFPEKLPLMSFQWVAVTLKDCVPTAFFAHLTM